MPDRRLKATRVPGKSIETHCPIRRNPLIRSFSLPSWRILNTVSTSPTPIVPQVGILVLDNNAPGGSAVKQILASEGWRVRTVQAAQILLPDLKTRQSSLLIPTSAFTA